MFAWIWQRIYLIAAIFMLIIVAVSIASSEYFLAIVWGAGSGFLFASEWNVRHSK